MKYRGFSDKSIKSVLIPLLIIIIVALSVKLINFYILKDNPFFNSPIMDELYNHKIAEEIEGGEILNNTPFYRAPLYVYFLAAIHKISIENLFTARLINLFLGLGVIIVLYLITKELWGVIVAIITAIIATFYPMLLYFDTFLLSTILETFLYLLGIYFLIKGFRDNRIYSLILSGLFFGLGAITRPTILPFLLLVGVLILFCRKKTFKLRLRNLSYFLIPVIVIVLTVTIINIIAGDDLVIIAWNGGINFYIGNNSNSTGCEATTPEIDSSWWGGYRDAISIAEEEMGKSLKPSEVSAYWYRMGFKFIRDNPVDWMKLLWKKAVLTIGNLEINNNQSISGFRSFSPLINIKFPNFAFIFSLGIAGIIISGLKRFDDRFLFLYILTYALTIIVFFTNARYRLPIVPILIAYSGFTIFSLISYIKRRNWKKLIIIGTIIVILLIVSLIDFYGLREILDNSAFQYGNIGRAYMLQGEYEKAIEAYEKAIEINPYEYHNYNALGLSLLNIGKDEEAYKYFLKSYELKPNARALSSMAQYHIEVGEYETARKLLREALLINPEDGQSLFYMGVVHMYYNEYNEAIVLFEKMLKNKVEEEIIKYVHYNLGLSYFMLDDYQSATIYFSKIPENFADTEKYLETISSEENIREE